MERIIVNWVKEDEELLEPYEWYPGDDIEFITSLTMYHVDDETLHDFIYGCLQVLDHHLYNKVFALGNGFYTIVVETNEKGKLCYRSVLNIEDRKRINEEIASLPNTVITYFMYDEGEMKEYGLTRDERIKKQFIDQRLDELYIHQLSDFIHLVRSLYIKEKENMKMYFILKKKIEHGYSFIHEYLYHELLKPQYKKK